MGEDNGGAGGGSRDGSRELAGGGKTTTGRLVDGR